MRKRSIKVFLVRRRVVAVLAALALAAGIFYAVSYPGSVSAAAAKRQLPIYSVERTDGKFCSISFDAAWGNEDTQILIDILARYDIKATFFVVGDWAEKYPESVKALHDAGHEVMSHSNHHDHYNTLTAEQIIADVTASNERISASTGVTPTLIRCPYGEYDDHVISAIRSMGMEPIQWDVDSLDWKDYDGLGYLSGHAVDEADGAMFDALVQTHASLDVPLIVLSAEQLDAPQLGELFYFFELTAALCAATDGLSPFDRKFSSPTRAQTAALLQKSAE